MDVHICSGLVINAPEIFADPEFRAWLANGRPKFTWYDGGEIGEWSDVVVLVDPSLSGEGSDGDMPASVWYRIVALCRFHFGTAPAPASHYMVRLTNLVTG